MQAGLLRLAARGLRHDAACGSSRCFAAGPAACKAEPRAGKDLTKVAKASDVTVSPEEIEAQTITVTPGQAHLGDLRSTSGLGLGDGLYSHTAKWLQAREASYQQGRAGQLAAAQRAATVLPGAQTDGYVSGNTKSPMQFAQEAPPIKVHGAVVASFGSDDPSLGCPVEYIDLRGTSVDSPAVCKYTGNKYYSDDWQHGAH